MPIFDKLKNAITSLDPNMLCRQYSNNNQINLNYRLVFYSLSGQV